MVVADTSAWIEFLQNPASEAGRIMDALLARREVALVGMVLIEVLQGARGRNEFTALQSRLMALDFLETTREVWVRLAELYIELRRRGAMIPMTDLIVAATAMHYGQPIYATDGHFERVPGLQLYQLSH